ncbi:hypothetical protein BV20DRAFT_225945 [Pilatotrama ljubarskyi]|nr:hypothetical protein BV20DRAFT_225945 [Pilatotrama ljubarskyi]
MTGRRCVPSPLQGDHKYWGKAYGWLDSEVHIPFCPPRFSKSSAPPATAMDAFFTIASPIPAEEPSTELPMDHDSTGTSGNHGSCIIA